MRLPVFVLAIALFGGSAAGQQVELQIETRTIQEGEVVELTLVCTNTGQPETPQVEVPPGLELRLVSTSPLSSSMVSIVNKRRSEKTTYTYTLRLTGVKAGSYTIPPITVPAGGTSFQTAAIPITVTKSEADAQKDGDKFMFARLIAHPASLYVTQPIEATLTLAIRKFERDGKPIDLGNMLQHVDASGSDLSVFGTRFNSSEITLQDSSGASHEYVVYRQTKEVRADQVGTMRIGPVFFKMNYPVSLRRSLFGGYEIAQHRRETARAAAVEIEVKGPPEHERPSDFTGAIGQFEFDVTAKPTQLEQGQPVTLTMTIKGQPLDGVAGPDMKTYPELSARFDFSPEESPGEKEGNAKVFRRAIFPKRQGEQVIPAISWSYFDPQTERYVTRTSEPIPIIVDPPSSPETISDFAADASESATKLTKTTGGISPNVVDVKRALANHDFTAGPVLLGVATVIPPALCFAAMLISWRGARLRGDPNFARRRFAGQKARTRIRQATARESAADRLHGLGEALTGFIADRFGLPPGVLTPDEARRVLALKTGDTALAAEASDFLSASDAARFAKIPTTTAADASRQAAQLIHRIEKAAP